MRNKSQRVRNKLKMIPYDVGSYVRESKTVKPMWVIRLHTMGGCIAGVTNDPEAKVDST